ncbi:MAG: hypothetical protein HYV32_06710 [Candidatus Kerfeldbacteria bacterium]|nr:hypothetical protein [Candidatus Kerfeldbacteria bacterium]
MMKNILQLQTYLQEQRIHGLAVDIDETLSWTIGYWVEQMQMHFGNPEQLSVQELVAKYQYTQNVPYWQTEEALQWMEDQRNSDELQTKLPLIPDSNTTLREINNIIPVVAYITIRPESVVNGTQHWLNAHGFPSAEIIARPSNIPTNKGNQWKADTLQQLYPQVIGIIDDSPHVVESLSADYPGEVYFYNTAKPKRTDIRIIPCPTWQDVLTHCKKNVNKATQVIAMD